MHAKNNGRDFKIVATNKRNGEMISSIIIMTILDSMVYFALYSILN